MPTPEENYIAHLEREIARLREERDEAWRVNEAIRNLLKPKPAASTCQCSEGDDYGANLSCPQCDCKVTSKPMSPLIASLITKANCMGQGCFQAPVERGYCHECLAERIHRGDIEPAAPTCGTCEGTGVRGFCKHGSLVCPDCGGEGEAK